MIHKWVLAFVFLFTPIFSNETSYKNDSSQVDAGIQGIFLTGKRENIASEGRATSTGIQVKDLPIPGSFQNLETQLKSYLGKPVSRQNVIEIKQKIMTYFVSQGMTMISVEIPEQVTYGGVIQILVTEKTFGQPIYKGETWYSNQQLNRYLGINPNQQISEDTLQNNLSWLNKNPFHYAKMKFVPGDGPDVLDIEFNMKKRRALRFYARGDDTGSSSTGYGRFATGFNWGNAFWIGDLFSFEYQFSNEFSRYQSYTATYTSFLPWQHIFTLLGTYATVKPFVPNKSVTAHATQVRPRYTIPFKPLYKPLQQSITLGFDYKNTNSSTLNLQDNSAEIQPSLTPAVVSEIDVGQFVANYTLYDKIGNHSVSFNFSVYGSPFAFLPHQTNQDYQKQRPNSSVHYCYFNVTAADVITIPKIMTISLLLRGQVSTHTLPATELMSMGGYNTVRGYHESEAAGDNGFIGNIELRSPSFSFFKKNKDELLFLAFLDYGLSSNWYVRKSTSVGAVQIPNTQYLLGVGPGLRYMVNPYFQVRLDYGFKLRQLFIPNSALNDLLLGFGQWHVGVLASF